jgi:hypothetical protein
MPGEPLWTCHPKEARFREQLVILSKLTCEQLVILSEPLCEQFVILSEAKDRCTSGSTR